VQAHRAVRGALPLDEMQSFEDASAASSPTDAPLKSGPAGDTVWDFEAYAFIEASAGHRQPEPVRQAKLNGHHDSSRSCR